MAGDLAKTISGGHSSAAPDDAKEKVSDVADVTREKLGSSRGKAQGLGEDFVGILDAFSREN